MSASDEPHVCVLTPVFNGEEYLVECVESLRAQTYRNFRHIIVNNCSMDRTLEIALRLAEQEPRLEVHTNDTFVNVTENHNIAFRKMPPEAKYCKILSADDALFPEFLTRMVAAAEQHPSAGFVGCYQLSGTHIRWQGFPYPKTLIDGRELGRQMLHSRDPSFGFGTPTSLLYRADLVRKSDPFYPSNFTHADTSVFYKHLIDCDYAFVYQVLCVERLVTDSVSPRAARLREEFPDTLSDLIEYGHYYLSAEEHEKMLGELLSLYHRTLAADLMSLKGSEFLAYHRQRLADLGHPLMTSTLLKAGLAKLIEEVANPRLLLSKAKRRIARASPKPQS